MDRVEGFEGLLQRAWDRFPCRKPVLLILIGSDLSMMSALNSYARPFHQRWTRTNEVEIDLVGADRAPVATTLLFVGSIKWHDRTAFDRHDEATLMRQRAQLTGDPVPLVAVSRSGIGSPAVDARYGPDDLIRAWQPHGHGGTASRPSSFVRQGSRQIPRASR